MSPPKQYGKRPGPQSPRHHRTQRYSFSARPSSCSVGGSKEDLRRLLELHALIGSESLGEAGFQLQALRLAGSGVGDILPEQDDLWSLGKREPFAAVLQHGGFG